MKTIILYESKHGNTKKCVDYIQAKKEADTVVQAKDFKGDLNSYDEILLCTPVYVGKINKSIKALIEQNEEIIIRKKTTIVVSAMNTDEYDAMITNNFSEKIRESVEIIYAGGGYNFDSMNFLSKMIIKKMTGYTSSYENILYKELDNIA